MVHVIIYKIARLCKNFLQVLESPKIVVLGAIFAGSIACGISLSCMICGVHLILNQFSFSLLLRCVLGGSIFFLPLNVWFFTRGFRRNK